MDPSIRTLLRSRNGPERLAMQRRSWLALPAWLAPSHPAQGQGRATATTTPVTVPADAHGRLRWQAWELYGRGGKRVHLATVDVRASASAPRLVATWQDAYSPALRQPRGWMRDGRPVAALTFQFGAAAAAVALLTLDAQDRPLRLDERLDAAMDWQDVPDGHDILVLSGRAGSALQPACLRWDGRALRDASCP